MEDIKLRSLKAVFKKFTTTSANDVNSSQTSETTETVDGMVDVDLTQVSAQTGQPLNQADLLND